MKTLLILSAVLSGLLAVTAAAAVGAAEAAPEEQHKDSQVAVAEVAVPVAQEELPEMISPEDEASFPEGRHFFCPTGWEKYKYGCYKHVGTTSSWTTAAASCASLGGSLPSVQDYFEYTFLQDLTKREGTTTTAWIGGFYFQNSWRWVDQSPYSYSNWQTYLSPTSYPCIYLNAKAGWSNASCAGGRPYICVKKVGAC